MAFEECDLPTLGSFARAHVEAGDKAKDKAEQQYKAAGLYLIEAKERVLRTKGITWPGWLIHNCPVGRSRADELIMIADGRTTNEELNSRKGAAREATKSTAPRGKSSEKPQQYQRPDPVSEARSTTSDARDTLLRNLIARLKTQPTEVLERIYSELN